MKIKLVSEGKRTFLAYSDIKTMKTDLVIYSGKTIAKAEMIRVPKEISVRSRKNTSRQNEPAAIKSNMENPFVPLHPQRRPIEI